VAPSHISPQEVRILTLSSEVTPFVSEVRQNADLEKDALGFLPAGVYDDAAKRDNLLVAVCGEKFAGHLLFGGRFPHARIFQLFVAPNFRSSGIGGRLVGRLVEVMEGYSFLSISARVAADLDANEFWSRMGFAIAGIKPGGPTRNRVINLRVKQLDTPDLFKLRPVATGGLGLVDRLATRQPVYVIDLNVFWDAVKQRARSEYAAEVISAALHQFIYIVVTSEFVKELQRTSRPAPTDPALEFALQLPILPDPGAPALDALVAELGNLVFPAKATTGTLSERDRSDLVHLATAIHHSANAFVTSENAIVRIADTVHRRYGVEILHVKELSAALKDAQRHIPAFRAQLSSDTLQFWELVAENSSSLEQFLRNNLAPADYREDFLSASSIAPARRRIVVTSATEIVCLASWDSNAGLQPRATVRLIADEEHPSVETAVNCVLNKISAEASRVGPVLLRLCTPPGHAISRKVGLLHGFQPPESDQSGETYLQKLSIGRPLTGSNWGKIRRTVQQCSGLTFPEAVPLADRSDVMVAFDTASGERRTLSLVQIERLLSPTLILGPNRAGSIVPIRRAYAEQLLQASAQMSLTPNREAGLFSNRVYFSCARNARVLLPGTAILFYESSSGGGRACITAIARVVTTEIHSKTAISAELLRHGVLESDDLVDLTVSDSISATTFDNVMPLDKPVRLERLRQIGCVDGSNLITARTIPYDQLLTIVEEGFSLV
jgi:GNAT superfamily N-acetyltransferase